MGCNLFEVESCGNSVKTYLVEFGANLVLLAEATTKAEEDLKTNGLSKLLLGHVHSAHL